MLVFLATTVLLVQSIPMKTNALPGFIVLLKHQVLISILVILERITNTKVSPEKKLVYYVKVDTTVQTLVCPATSNSVVNQGTTVHPVPATIVVMNVQMGHFVKLGQFNPNPVLMDTTQMVLNQTALLVQLVKYALTLMALAPLVVKNVRLVSTVRAVM